MYLVHLQYIRVGYPTDGTEAQKAAVIANTKELLINKLKLQRPNLILSVTGGAESFRASNIQQKRFKRGIIRTAIRTGERSH